MIVKAALVGLLYWISMGRAQYFFSFAFRKPVVLGVFIGLVFGDVQAGLLYGATIQLMYMGGIEAGGNIPSDQGLATCIAIPAAIAGGMDASAAVALAVPFGVLGVLINNVPSILSSAPEQMLVSRKKSMTNFLNTVLYFRGLLTVYFTSHRYLSQPGWEPA